MSRHVCVLGSINMDLVIRAPHLPSPGETVLGGPFRTFPGGKGANQAVSAARLGASVAMIGAVGDDAYGESLRTLLGEEGIDIKHVHVADDHTGVGVITIDGRGENVIVVGSGANQRVRPEHVDLARDTIGRADVLVMQLELPLETVEHAMGVARAVGTPVLLNTAPAPEAPDAWVRESPEILVLNRPEASALTGLSEKETPAALLAGAHRARQGTTILTLGSAGSIGVAAPASAGADEAVSIPAIDVCALDSVGAGDAFVGALAAHGVGPANLADAMRFASGAGAVAVTRAGAIPSLPTRAEVEASLGR